ncbi:hypothetical protein EKE94_05345 [Mesobaculum littorinae]|uniref:Uncharacterized protein n=1 Tax=Mesobaculum littorinae TaxID=2486419 RepID=A0A438AHZ5_9RHOB|nr:hypothetical protein [Mesobaculum littorinae]RVV98351.1 hypothetical protein EKE94_05345 [Mesobaculum littorinae]
MTSDITIPADDHDTVRVFALDMPADGIARFRDRREDTDDPAAAWPLRHALGADHLDPDAVEAFPISDLEGLGLSGYLTEGHGIAAQDVLAARDRLDAVTGAVVLLPSRAFGGVAQTLHPRAPLDYVGAFHEAGARPAGPAPQSAAASAAAAQQAAPPPEPNRSRARAPVRVPVFLGLAVAALVILVIALLVTGTAGPAGGGASGGGG